MEAATKNVALSFCVTFLVDMCFHSSFGIISGSGIPGAYGRGLFDFNFLIFSSGFFVDSLGFYTQIIMLSVTKDRFMSSFSNCGLFVCLFVFFFLLPFYTG